MLLYNGLMADFYVRQQAPLFFGNSFGAKWTQFSSNKWFNTNGIEKMITDHEIT